MNKLLIIATVLLVSVASMPLVANAETPGITNISPSSAVTGSAGTTVTVNGTNFVSGSTVRFNGVNIPTTYLSSAQLIASIPASSLAVSGSFPITVLNPDATVSGSLTFNVGTSSSVPIISSLSPTSAVMGSSGITLTVTGSNFASGAVVRFNGSPVSTTFVSSTQLTAAIPTSSLANSGNFLVTVTNPNGFVSGSITFTVVSSTNAPTISSISPSSAVMGSSAITLTVNGTNFVSGATVKFNGSSVSTTFVSSTQLTASLPSSSFSNSGNFLVTVTNPNGQVSGSSTFTVSTSTANPTITSISPSMAITGSAARTLIVTGTNFASGAVVKFNGVSLTTTLVSSTQLTAAVPASSFANAGNFSVTVTNPNGSVSGSMVFTVITIPPLPDTGISPYGIDITALIAAVVLSLALLVGAIQLKRISGK